MTPAAHYWLTLVLLTWTVSSVAVLVAMLGSIVRHLQRAGRGPAFRAGTMVELAWLLVPVTIVILMVVLAFRVGPGGG